MSNNSQIADEKLQVTCNLEGERKKTEKVVAVNGEEKNNKVVNDVAMENKKGLVENEEETEKKDGDMPSTSQAKVSNAPPRRCRKRWLAELVRDIARAEALERYEDELRFGRDSDDESLLDDPALLIGRHARQNRAYKKRTTFRSVNGHGREVTDSSSDESVVNETPTLPPPTYDITDEDHPDNFDWRF